MKNRKIFVVGPEKVYANWMEGEIVRHLEEANLIVFTGGEDVHPSLYNDVIHPRSSCNLGRDKYEQAWFEQAKLRGIHMIGICRGLSN